MGLRRAPRALPVAVAELLFQRGGRAVEHRRRRYLADIRVEVELEGEAPCRPEGTFDLRIVPKT